MNDIKRFVKNEKGLKALVQTKRIYNQDIEIEFGVEKCAILKMRSGKRQITKGI